MVNVLSYKQKKFLEVMGKSGEFKEYFKEKKSFLKFLKRERTDVDISEIFRFKKKAENGSND